MSRKKLIMRRSTKTSPNLCAYLLLAVMLACAPRTATPAAAAVPAQSATPAQSAPSTPPAQAALSKPSAQVVPSTAPGESAPSTARAQAAPSTAPVQPAKPADSQDSVAAALAQLTPYQRSQILRTFNDWAFLDKYRQADADLPAPRPGENRIVFMGDSITEGWGRNATGPAAADGAFFPGKPYINRGISGQTSPQMLVRFRQDVLDLNPKVVLILAGTNDIAENTGKITIEAIEGNIASMSELARAHGIRPVLCSVLPASDFHWHPGLDPAPKIKALNALIKDYAAKNHFIYVDYYSKMADTQGALPPNLSHDGVHPNADGYAIMAPLAKAAITAALKMPLH